MPIASILCFIDLAMAPQIRISICKALNCVVLAIIAFCRQGVRERIGLLPGLYSMITRSSAASKTVETRSPKTGMAILIGPTSNPVVYRKHARKGGGGKKKDMLNIIVRYGSWRSVLQEVWVADMRTAERR